MHHALDLLRETFTVYLAASILLTFASAWATVKAVRAGRDRLDWPRR
jgi:hypothetical protein